MIDLRRDLTQTWRAISRTPSRGGARAVMFISARTGEGTSSIAASFAMLAAQRSSKGVWLMDLDLTNNAQYKSFKHGAFSQINGPMGPAHPADLGDVSFFNVTPVNPEASSERDRLVVHRAGKSRLLVSHFRTELLKPNQEVRIRTGAAYWQKVRSIADWIIVDAPSIDQSGAGLAVCSQMDAVVTVVRADKTPVAEAARISQEIEAHGGVCAGVVLNAVKGDAQFMDQFAG